MIKSLVFLRIDKVFVKKILKLILGLHMHHLHYIAFPGAVTWLHANLHKERFLLSRFGWIAEELGAYKAAYRFCDWNYYYYFRSAQSQYLQYTTYCRTILPELSSIFFFQTYFSAFGISNYTYQTSMESIIQPMRHCFRLKFVGSLLVTNLHFPPGKTLGLEHN